MGLGGVGRSTQEGRSSAQTSLPSDLSSQFRIHIRPKPFSMKENKSYWQLLIPEGKSCSLSGTLNHLMSVFNEKSQISDEKYPDKQQCLTGLGKTHSVGWYLQRLLEFRGMTEKEADPQKRSRGLTGRTREKEETPKGAPRQAIRQK